MQLSKHDSTFTKAQLRTIIGCFIAYSSAYIGRLNLAEALPAIAAECGYSGVRLGWLQTLFAITYASGQLIIGALADRHRPLKFVLIGMLGTAICNFCVGLANSYALMLAFWLLNGICQSMLWTPVMRLISQWFSGARRARACFIMSASSIVGHLLSWSIAATATSLFSWRAAFFAPGIILFGVFVSSALLIRNHSASNEGSSADSAQTHRERITFRTLIFSTGLCSLLVTCVANGFVRDGITTWAPSILANAFGGNRSAAFYSLIIPVINIFGWILSQACFKRIKGGARPSIVVLLTICAVILGSTFVLHTASVVVLAFTMGIACAIMQGNTPLLTAMLPMEYASADHVALVAGMIDCFIYIGSAISGVLVGYITDSDPAMIYPLCALICLIGALFAFLSIGPGRKLQDTD